MTSLVVVRPFGPYTTGAPISDAAAIAEILNGPDSAFVVRTSAAGGSAPAALPNADAAMVASGSLTQTLPTMVAAVDLGAGMPVAVSRANGRMIAARADQKATAFVAGLLGADCAAGFAATPLLGSVTLTDWTSATGAKALRPGQAYFLDADGGLTLQPDAMQVACVVRVGIAASATTLVVRPTDPIQL